MPLGTLSLHTLEQRPNTPRILAQTVTPGTQGRTPVRSLLTMTLTTTLGRTTPGSLARMKSLITQAIGSRMDITVPHHTVSQATTHHACAVVISPTQTTAMLPTMGQTVGMARGEGRTP
jgi:hypothetical protein